MIKSQNLCEQAKLHWESRGACFWNGRILPRNLRASKPRRVSEAEARAKAENDFVEALDKECLVATDGAGGAVGSRSERHRAVGAVAAVVSFGPNRKPDHVTCMRMKVPGRQTVPRAETWAVLQLLKVMKGEKGMKIITDAMYVFKGFKIPTRKAILKANLAIFGGKCSCRWTASALSQQYTRSRATSQRWRR